MISILRRLSKISQLKQDLIRQYYYYYLNRQSMEVLQIYKQQLRRQKRAEQLENFKANSRNVLLYFTYSNKCLFCSGNDWINKSSQHIVNLVLSMFSNGSVCHQHNSLLIQKTKICLMEAPNHYRKIMHVGQQNKHTKKHLIMKLVLFIQLLDQKILSASQKLYQQIQDSLQAKDTFILYLMDCAYEYNSWPLQQDQDQSWNSDKYQQWNSHLKRLSFQIYIQILNRFPFQVYNLLQEYPLQTLLSIKTKSCKIIVYQSIGLLLGNYSANTIKHSCSIMLIECALAYHLEQIGNVQMEAQLIDGIVFWIYALLCTGISLKQSSLSLIKQFLCRIQQPSSFKAAICNLLSSNHVFAQQVSSQHKNIKHILSAAQSSNVMEVEE